MAKLKHKSAGRLPDSASNVAHWGGNLRKLRGTDGGAPAEAPQPSPSVPAAAQHSAGQSTDCRIFGVAFSQLTLQDIVQLVADPVPAGQGVRLIVTANTYHIVQLRRDAGLRQAYKHAYIRTIDGAPVMIYAKLRHSTVPERVTGSDLVPPVLESMRPGVCRLGFMAPNAIIADRLRAWCLARGFAEDDLLIEVPPFGFERDEAYSLALTQRITRAGITHLFIGVGCPKSEIWTQTYRAQLGDAYVFAIGMALAFFVGEQRRAPAWMRRTGTEWFWRFMLEPRRLGRRYFVECLGFFEAVFADILGRCSEL
jgi:N-acetylglucosaminyldiphosphoundecaprenol N-acetyl-beta-D-mannosaminyltransferase